MTQYDIEKNVAIVICKSFCEDPYSDAWGINNEYRWEDFLENARDVIYFIKHNQYDLFDEKVK